MVSIEGLNISFNNEVIFNNFSLSLLKGEKLAITGKSGKGKSTLLNLLAGFIPEFTGKVSVFGQELSPLTVSEIRSFCSFVY